MFICILIRALRGNYMYSDDIKDLKKQKREANQNILFSFIRIYISLRTGFPELIKERDDLVKMVSRYFESDRNESEVLRLINQKYGNRDDHEGVDELLEEFDDMFEQLYNHCDKTFLDYEEFLEDYGDFLDLLFRRIQNGGKDDIESYRRYRLTHRPIDFQTFDQQYKQKMLEKVTHLPEPVEVDF